MESNPRQTLHQAIQKQFGLQNAGEGGSSKLSSDSPTTSSPNPAQRHQFVIPQLRIPQLLPQTPIDLAAQERSRQEANERNEKLLNEIKRRRKLSESENPLGVSEGFIIPNLSIPGAPLGETKLNIPLLERLERSVGELHISSSGEGDRATAPATPLIDLTSTVIVGAKNAPPKESASKARQKQKGRNSESFEIPFIACDQSTRRCPFSGGLLASRKYPHEEEAATEAAQDIHEIREEPSVVGIMLDTILGYPEPRQPQLDYAVTRLERQHLKMYAMEEYGSQVKRFRFDTPSPDELVKQALQKSWRISRT
ncbi:hypothetical protein KR009_002863 [Drosophila setifemur]|nr:hypothetical protein KR009_002863 [Drosophila setifemur]